MRQYPARGAAVWVLPALIGVLYLVAGYLNAHEFLSGAPPSLLGLVASATYGLVWLAHAFDAGRRGSSRDIRLMAVIWALVIAGTSLCSTYVRLNVASGVSFTGGGWGAPALLLVLAGPLYGLVAPFNGEPLTFLTAVTVGAAALTMAFALAPGKLFKTAS